MNPGSVTELLRADSGSRYADASSLLFIERLRYPESAARLSCRSWKEAAFGEKAMERGGHFSFACDGGDDAVLPHTASMMRWALSIKCGLLSVRLGFPKA